MRRYLVVANQTLCGDHLLEVARGCVAEGPCSFHVVVPANPPLSTLSSTDEDDVAAAHERLQFALERFRAMGVEATGEVGDARPLDAIGDVVRREHFDEIILSTLPPGVSRWLGMDLVSRLQRSSPLPVRHIVLESTVPAGR